MENSAIKPIRGVIFDYGGTIDNCGDHWAVVIREAYDTLPILQLDLDLFCKGYVFAERELAKVRHILPHHTFRQMMETKARLELEELVRLGAPINEGDIPAFAAQIADYTDAHARQCIEKARPTLDYLAQRYPMALVSNFYGNIEAVLNEYGLAKYFPTVIESAVVGVRKPDPAIFKLGVDALGLESQQVLVVGDSVSKDILPARSLGCQTAWIGGRPWFYETKAEAPGLAIDNLEELQMLY